MQIQIQTAYSLLIQFTVHTLEPLRQTLPDLLPGVALPENAEMSNSNYKQVKQHKNKIIQMVNNTPS